MGVGYVAVEGHGDVAAVPNLLTRLCADLDLLDVVWMTPIRSRRLAQKRGLREVCELVRTKPDADMLLVFRDEDDGCPMTRLVDFSCVRERGLSWFGTLERALGFLVERRAAGAGEVYPPPVGPREDGGYGPSP